MRWEFLTTRTKKESVDYTANYDILIYMEVYAHIWNNIIARDFVIYFQS